MILANDKPRVLVPRDHIWASEIGKAPIDIWLAMRATPYSTPPNIRSRRKFIAGDVWEWLVVRMLIVAGVFQSRQDHLRFQYPGLLEVTGKLDIIAGGMPDFEKARYNMTEGAMKVFFEEEEQGFGYRLQQTLLGITRELEKVANGQELKQLIVEVKSCSAFMFDKYERTGKASPNHVMQLFHYLKAKGFDEGHILYVCKDDSRMIEFAVFNPSPAEEIYKNYITLISENHKSTERPALAPLTVFDTDEAKFMKNWNVEYSNYLEMLYGYKTPDEYRQEWEPQINSWNRVFKRCVNGDRMTPGNLDVIERVKEIYPTWDELVEMGKKLKAEGLLAEEPAEGEAA